MFAFKFILAIIGINPARAEEATSEDEKQVMSLKQEEDKQQIVSRYQFLQKSKNSPKINIFGVQYWPKSD